MATIVSIISRRGLTIEAHHRNQSNKNKLALYKLLFLNQARAGLWPARAWFLKIDPVRTSVCVCVCVCVRPRGY